MNMQSETQPTSGDQPRDALTCPGMTREWLLENQALGWRWRLTEGRLRPGSLEDRRNGERLDLGDEPFQLVMGDGTTVKASDFTLIEAPCLDPLRPEPDSPTMARHFAGWQLVARLAAPRWNLAAQWRALLREGSSYARQELTLQATGEDVWIREIVLIDHPLPGAGTMGTVDGAPVVAGRVFVGYEHPMARNRVGPADRVRCSYERNAVLKDGEALTQTCVRGFAPPGQLRRGFLAYLERERAHPFRPFLHYNSWFDISYETRKFDEAESLQAIEQFGRELVAKRGVRLDSFLMDDGWDDNRTLWKFHRGFPNGFTPLQEAATRLNSAIGVWISPFGGYLDVKEQRLEYGRQHGFETNPSGFSLAGPNYYRRFRDICLEMMGQYGVNQFKFDGLDAAAQGGSNQNSLTRDGDAMVRLIGELRAAKPDVLVNQTAGTWPSPFWLLYVDAIWRGGRDTGFAGKGSDRQQWITYRDMITYREVVQASPLYPLNSLMLHGIIWATYAGKLSTAQDQDFADEVHDFFGSGTQLQELYLTPRLLNQRNWDDLAEAAQWSRANADVLVDTHWVGGDPGRDEVYGWASWASRKAIVVLRNPSDQPGEFTADVAQLFELPEGAPQDFRLRRPWKASRELPGLELRAGLPHTFSLQPFEVLVLESEGGSDYGAAG